MFSTHVLLTPLTWMPEPLAFVPSMTTPLRCIPRMCRPLVSPLPGSTETDSR